MPFGLWERISSAGLLYGRISQYTPHSRTLLAISCAYCPPKSMMITVSWCFIPFLLSELIQNLCGKFQIIRHIIPQKALSFTVFPVKITDVPAIKKSRHTHFVYTAFVFIQLPREAVLQEIRYRHASLHRLRQEWQPGSRLGRPLFLPVLSRLS